ncbi:MULTISPECIES: hypothetical protein [unclassified Caballeronia]|uniref:hypothetical protein n=1 Tax=unclassified Caballeronia TaxID=2646786 RepID=UPI0020287096|nr:MULTISPECIES: hypothetical protein [unclassified Caballeronia]
MGSDFFTGVDRGRNSLDLLSASEIRDLCELNLRLYKVETWICERARRALADYHRRGGTSRTRPDESILEDGLIDITVEFILSSRHPQYSTYDDNIIARLDFNKELVDDRVRDGDWNELPPPNALSSARICLLFHDLCWHTFAGDYDKMLAVGGVWVDIRVIDQRIENWS